MPLLLKVASISLWLEVCCIENTNRPCLLYCWSLDFRVFPFWRIAEIEHLYRENYQVFAIHRCSTKRSTCSLFLRKVLVSFGFRCTFQCYVLLFQRENLFDDFTPCLVLCVFIERLQCISKLKTYTLFQSKECIFQTVSFSSRTCVANMCIRFT